MRDPAQEALVGRLQALQRQLQKADAARTGLLARIVGASPAPVRGLYIWGGVGRGKTFLMDLFFETLAIQQKRRVHFHRAMHDVHHRLRQLVDIEDPLDRVASDMARDTRVLCFDEFFVSDIGDAMILARLLHGLFDRGVTLVTTSNSPPAELYKTGLQRERFLPAISLLEQHTEVINMDSGTDYRLRQLQKAGTYLVPAGSGADARLSGLFDETASSQIAAGKELDINGRRIRTRRCAKGIAWFHFGDICDGPRSQTDYIELARWYPEVIVSDVPFFDGSNEDQARRFISLVDEFYDRRVKLILSAARPANELYGGNKLAFEFGRTSSRLIEMQSNEYLAQAHLPD